MRNRSLLLLFVLTGLLTVVGVASGAAPKKAPFKITAKTCATYASAAYVKAATGLVGTLEKYPNGECSYTVAGKHHAFSIVIAVTASPAAAVGQVNLGYSQDMTQINQGVTCPTATDQTVVCPSPTKVAGFGNAAVSWDTGNATPNGFDWLTVARGSQIIGIQASGPGYVPVATEEAIAKHLLAIVPAK
jgi:hypothetical protein